MKKLLLILLLLPTLLAAKVPERLVTLTSLNTIRFNQAFTPSYVADKQEEATKLCRSNLGKDIYLVLYTPGGSVQAGNLLFDTLNSLPCKFHTITLFAASMGFQAVQQLGERLILKSGVLMSHRASLGGVGGELGGEMDSFLNLIRTQVTEMEEVAAKRAGVSLKYYRQLIRDELWMTGTQAVKMNYADAIVNVVCDESLVGTFQSTVQSFFGTYDVSMSKCPIITAPLTVKGRNNKSEETKDQYIKSILDLKTQVKTTL